MPSRGLVIGNGKAVNVSGKEMIILEALAARFPNVVTTDQFLDALYSGMDEPKAKIIDVFVCRVRKKVAPLGVDIQTVWGRGYALGVRPALIKGDAA